MVVLDLFWILYCLAEGHEDAWYQRINHWRAVLRRIATGLVVGYSICGIGENWVLYINTAFVLGLLFLVFFNISRNLSAGKQWHYIGKTASWDKFFRQFPRVAVWTVFFILLALSLIVQWYHSSYIVRFDNLINTTWLF